jgi:hypothetical protein
MPADPVVSPTEGTVFNGEIGRFTDSDGNTNPALYSATITWGDGQTSAGTVYT